MSGVIPIKVVKWGNSYALRIPAPVVTSSSITEGQEVGVQLTKTGFEVITRPRYRLADLLAQCNPKAKLDAASREWLDAPAVGAEEI